MSKVRTPRTKDQAAVLLDRFAALSGTLAAGETARNAAIAETNAVADTVAAPLIEELQAIRVALEPWWRSVAAELTQGKRKSIELGGCMIGSKSGRASLSHNLTDDAAALAALQDARWAKPYVRVSYAIDRTATLKALADGPHKAKLAELGFVRQTGSDDFYVERVAQAGTIPA